MQRTTSNRQWGSHEEVMQNINDSLDQNSSPIEENWHAKTSRKVP
ncbi:hypothetical protein ACFFGV_00380 [Pontibacillus salicampi]|uniref:Uncharacterized protein n=1 Tax=Pontibacillus salicampi TaxID=1449801 RepID=A0ABV6LI25_9BACI